MQQDNAKGSTALQAQVVNVYPNGITEEKCREIFMDLYKTNVLSLRDEAKDVACQRAEQLTDIFIQKLSKQDDEIRKKIEDQLKEPAMQEAIFKSQKCFAMSNDDDHLKILTDMLIDRGSISQRTNKQMLIDEAIDVLPRLNQKHLDVLAFYSFIDVFYPSYDEHLLKSQINDLIKYLQNIIPLKSRDSNLQYLAQKNCLQTFDGITHLKDINIILGERVTLLHSGFSEKEYDDLITVNIPEIPFAKSLINPENIVINTTLENLKYILKNRNIDKTNYDNIINFWHKNNDQSDSAFVKDYILNNFEYGYLLFENWQYLRDYNIFPLGITIAHTYIRTKYQQKINWNFE